MSEVDSRKSVYLTRQVAALLVRDAARESSRPALQHIFFEDGFAYYTNRFFVVRWDLRGLELPDGSWIDLVPPDTDSLPDAHIDTKGNLAAWVKIATRRSSWDLMNPDRWRSPDEFEGTHPNAGKLFRLPDGPVEPVESVAFNPEYLRVLSVIISGSFNTFLRLIPSKSESPQNAPWWLTGTDEQVVALLVPMRSGYTMDKPYVPETKKQETEATK
jgi:hypothetical protein